MIGNRARLTSRGVEREYARESSQFSTRVRVMQMCVITNIDYVYVIDIYK